MDLTANRATTKGRTLFMEGPATIRSKAPVAEIKYMEETATIYSGVITTGTTSMAEPEMTRSTATGGPIGSGAMKVMTSF